MNERGLDGLGHLRLIVDPSGPRRLRRAELYALPHCTEQHCRTRMVALIFDPKWLPIFDAHRSTSERDPHSDHDPSETPMSTRTHGYEYEAKMATVGHGVLL